jgi:hypothetical protein
MKIIFIVLLSLLSFNALARQYTQCSHPEFYSVVNLPTQEAGTLFITQGVETDNRWLTEIRLTHADQTHNFYEFINSDIEGSVRVPNDIFGQYRNGLTVTIEISGQIYNTSCFTSYYPE